MEALTPIVPTETPNDQGPGSGHYYECAEHGFFVAGSPDPDGEDSYIDDMIDEHERMHREADAAAGRQPAIAIDGDRVVFGTVAAAPEADEDDTALLRTLAGTHRRIVADDLVGLAERAADLIESTGCTVGDPTWEVLRNAHDATLALAELLNASRRESRDIAALGEHALLVVGTAVAAVQQPGAPAPAEESLEDRIVHAIIDLPQTVAEIGEVLDADGEEVESALQRLRDAGRVHGQWWTGRAARWVATR